ncbi:MAG: branched-chain amino acid ABC transporter permease [Christensenellaceae bacterium]|jgi:branched-chain amino acid transport system permease protein|nr:branched-chain amino acid ABC transporter permease [Christensenellaceae bacterium]
MLEFFQQLANGLIIGSTYALLTIGLTMVFGLMQILNYAHGEFYMLGGVVAFWVTQALHLNFFLSIIVTVAICFMLGLVFERILMRRLYEVPIVTTAIVTVGLSIFLQNSVFMLWGNVPRTIPTPFPLKPLTIGGLTFTSLRIFVLIVTIAVIVFTQIIIHRTKLGRAMRATFQDKDVAAMTGISIRKIYALTFAYGSALAGLAGVLCGSYLTISPFMGSSVTTKAWAIAIVGGIGNIPGAIFGGFLLGVVESLGAGYLSAAYKDAYSFIIVILVLVFRPNGLFSKKEL